MNLNTITEVKRPASADQITQWRDGYAWLAGGTWLFSEPQVATDTLIDLDALAWPALQQSSAGLEIAATCRITELYRFAGPPEWRAGAVEAVRLPSRLAHPSRAVGGAGDRYPGKRRPPADHFSRHAEADPAPVRARTLRDRAATGDRCAHPGRRLFQRRPRLGRLQ